MHRPVAYDAEGRPLYLHPPSEAVVDADKYDTGIGQQTQPSKSPSDTEGSPKNDKQYNIETPDVKDIPSPEEDPVVKDVVNKSDEEGVADQAKVTTVSSHVTNQPDDYAGQNFHPKIRSQYANEPDVVHTTRSVETKAFVISDKVKRKHEKSVERYPYLNLSKGEFVILDIKRHPIGMLFPISITLLLIIAILWFASLYPSIYSSAYLSIMPQPALMFGIIVLFVVLVVLSCAAYLWVYLQNQFFMTNESVIQEIQETLFARREQTVSLGSIEDASYNQAGILQTVLNYGTIRLSTEGEETTYLFHYVENPRHQISILNNAIESFKNGRPVDDPHDS